MIALVPSGRRIDMPELLGMGRKIGLRIGLFPIHEYWRDLGRPDDLDAAQTEVAGIERRQRD
jgi:NDP-sugar pyrophosphorylase family protein